MNLPTGINAFVMIPHTHASIVVSFVDTCTQTHANLQPHHSPPNQKSEPPSQNPHSSPSSPNTPHNPVHYHLPLNNTPPQHLSISTKNIQSLPSPPHTIPPPNTPAPSLTGTPLNSSRNLAVSLTLSIVTRTRRTTAALGSGKEGVSWKCHWGTPVGERVSSAL